jgi:hypothetical protein
MNARLAEFLISIVNDPAKLTAFNDPDSDARREELLLHSGLPDEDKAALRSGDAAEVLRRLHATEEDGLTWVLNPAIKKFTVGFAIKMTEAAGIPIKDTSLAGKAARLAGALPIKDSALGGLARKKVAGPTGRQKKAPAGTKKGAGAAAPRKTGGRGSTRKRG